MDLEKEQIAKLVDRITAELDVLAGLASAFDPGMGKALLNIAVLLRGGLRDLVVGLLASDEINREAMRIVKAAFEEMDGGLLDARRAD